ncbi:MAG: 50S ribosomal protein L10 [Rickettsiales bacterium]|jgi:large subunit ribosomal protein L10|nr:50S ribosomal protein L10 [Rickettsiales bacterium]
MKRQDKESLVGALKQELDSAKGLFVVQNDGVAVKDMEKLRRELAPAVSMFRVTKNRLLRIALKSTTFEPVQELLHKPTAVVFATDPLAATKVLAKFAEANQKLVLLGGFMDSEMMDASGIVRLSKLPSLNEIRATIARMLVEPASRLARVSKEYGNKQ